MTTRTAASIAGVAAIAALAGVANLIVDNAFAHQPPPQHVQQQGQQQGQPADRGANPLMMNLPKAVADTPGCLGVELAQTASGKNVIFAWFENKKAAERWYWSETHQQVMRLAGAEPGEKEPMTGVPEEGPILVIASITQSRPGEDNAFDGMGVSQIAIELYQPLPGGAEIGGRFAPAGLKVEDLTDYEGE